MPWERDKLGNLILNRLSADGRQRTDPGHPLSVRHQGCNNLTDICPG